MVMACVTMRIAWLPVPSGIHSDLARRPLAGTNLAWALQKLEQTTLQPILEKLYQAQTLSQQESHQLFSAVVRGELKPEQLARRAGEYESAW
jgi:anthranilate synthase/phosphoribosyltransferase